MDIRRIYSFNKALMCTRHRNKKGTPKHNPYYQFKNEDPYTPQRRRRTTKEMIFEIRRGITRVKSSLFPFLKSLMCFSFISRFTFCTLILLFIYQKQQSDSNFVKYVKIKEGDEQRYSRTIGMEKEFDDILIQNREKKNQ